MSKTNPLHNKHSKNQITGHNFSQHVFVNPLHTEKDKSLITTNHFTTFVLISSVPCLSGRTASKHQRRTRQKNQYWASVRTACFSWPTAQGIRQQPHQGTPFYTPRFDTLCMLHLTWRSIKTPKLNMTEVSSIEFIAHTMCLLSHYTKNMIKASSLNFISHSAFKHYQCFTFTVGPHPNEKMKQEKHIIIGLHFTEHALLTHITTKRAKQKPKYKSTNTNRQIHKTKKQVHETKTAQTQKANKTQTHVTMIGKLGGQLPQRGRQRQSCTSFGLPTHSLTLQHGPKATHANATSCFLTEWKANATERKHKNKKKEPQSQNANQKRNSKRQVAYAQPKGNNTQTKRNNKQLQIQQTNPNPTCYMQANKQIRFHHANPNPTRKSGSNMKIQIQHASPNSTCNRNPKGKSKSNVSILSCFKSQMTYNPR